jgi:hypothetical protein
VIFEFADQTMEPRNQRTGVEEELRALNAERKRDAEEFDRINRLIQRYKMEMPQISAQWDLSQDSVQHNVMPEGYEENEMVIFECDMAGFLGGLDDPSAFDPSTLWTTEHWEDNIAKVIKAWENQQRLSPVVLIKYGDEKDLAFVSDGKHRLTVARACGATSIPFMVGQKLVSWAETTFPTARRITV